MATALPLPNLDDRRWADLVDEGRALIPFYAPEWTDHNVHDPGITLIELFAWLAEMDLFELNQITDVHRLKFLALAGITPELARPARSLLELILADNLPPAQLPVTIAAGLEFAGVDPFGEPVPFQAMHDLTVVPGTIAALLSESGKSLQNLTNAWTRKEPIQPFGADPGPGDGFYIGLKLPPGWGSGATVSLGFAIDEAGGLPGPRERARITTEMIDAARDCAPPWGTGCCLPPAAPEQLEDGDQVSDDAPDPDLPHHSARLIWEVLTGENQWTRLTPEEAAWDGTRALTLSGRVALTLPSATFAQKLGETPEPLSWLRVRIARGRHDVAPVLRAIALNAVEVEQSVPAVARLQIAPGIVLPAEPGPIGQLIDLDLDVSPLGVVTRLAFGPVQQGRPAIRLLEYSQAARTVIFEAAALTSGSGAPSMDVICTSSPLVKGSVRFASIETGGARWWQVRPDFDASTRADPHVVVDAGLGVITTGDGERGRTAPAQSTLVAFADVTRADRGNLAAGTVTKIADSPRNRALFADLLPPFVKLKRIANVVPATGGTAAETVPAAIARAREDRERALRAVTLEDHVELAKETPGVRIARAEARANFHPGFPCLTAPGIVTLLILPHLPADRPEPTAGLRWMVSSYLNRRRVIGTRLEVAGPVYVRVTVRADVQAQPGARPAEVATAIREALERFFHPLLGGPAGSGWPFGRDVYRSEVLQVIDETPGVAHVLSLELVKGDDPPTCGNLCLGPTGLVDAGDHEISVTARAGNGK